MNIATIKKQLQDASARLTKTSVNNIYHVQEKVTFPETMNMQQWFFSEELSSLKDSPIYTKLSIEEKMRLSFYEAVNFFCINIHGEKALLEGLTRRLYENISEEVDQYLHHFVDEENKHMYLFGNFCQKYAHKIYPDRKVLFPREYVDGEEEFLFYIKVFIFEEIVDYYNVTMAQDKRLEPTCQAINSNHHDDESRHLAFGRLMVNYLFLKYKEQWGEKVVAELRRHVAQFYQMTWREYYNPDVYKDAGIQDHYKVSEDVFNSERAQEFRRKVSNHSISYLIKCGILEQGFKL